MVLGIPWQHGRGGRAATTPAVKAAVIEMADFTGKSTDPDAAFQQALTAVGRMVAKARKRGELTSVVLKLEKNAIYKIRRPVEVTQHESLEINGQGARIVNTTGQSTLHVTCQSTTIRCHSRKES
jgi:hypothetical protein